MPKFPAAYTRMRALKGKLLSPEDFRSLLKLRGFNEAIYYLRERTGLEITELSSLQHIEHRLKKSLLESYLKILRFLSGTPAEIVAALLSKFELIDLKAILHSKLAGKELPQSYIFDLGINAMVDTEELLKAKGIEPCFNILKGTAYEKPLALIAKTISREKAYLLDLSLDLNYYRRLYSSLSDLFFTDRQEAKGFVGTQIDVLNIKRYLRLRYIYSFSPGEIFHYLLPHGLRFTESQFWQIAKVEDLASVFAIRPYSQILPIEAQSNGEFILATEIRLNRFLYDFAKKEIIKRSPFHLTPILAFFVLKEFEVKDIISILNGKKLGLTEPAINRFLVSLGN